MEESEDLTYFYENQYRKNKGNWRPGKPGRPPNIWREFEEYLKWKRAKYLGVENGDNRSDRRRDSSLLGILASVLNAPQTIKEISDTFGSEFEEPFLKELFKQAGKIAGIITAVVAWYSLEEKWTEKTIVGTEKKFVRYTDAYLNRYEKWRERILSQIDLEIQNGRTSVEIPDTSFDVFLAKNPPSESDKIYKEVPKYEEKPKLPPILHVLVDLLFILTHLLDTAIDYLDPDHWKKASEKIGKKTMEFSLKYFTSASTLGKILSSF